MPVKNAMPYLKECLNSIINQTYQNWELIAVNDHSEDQSASVLSEFESKDERIKWLDNRGLGIIDALQLGYRHSTGDLITRMDADDIMTADKLNSMVEALRHSGPSHVAVGLVKYFKEGGPIGDGYNKYAEWLNELTSQSANFTDKYRECTIPSPCWMMSRSDFDLVGGFENDQYPEDYDLVFRMAESSMKVAPVTKVIHLWRDHSTRASRNDPNYADNRFLEMKLNYFMKLDRVQSMPLYIWGAGKKGKSIVGKLQKSNIHIYWLTDNAKKIGSEIYNIRLAHFDELSEANDGQVIIAIGAPTAKIEIKRFIEANPQHDYFWFC